MVRNAPRCTLLFHIRFSYDIARVLIVPKTDELCVSQMISSRLPQMLSIYLLMFSLGSMTRYPLGDFDDLFESGYGPSFDTFLLASPVRRPAITGREVYIIAPV
jgi:hypothetical protein